MRLELFLSHLEFRGLEFLSGGESGLWLLATEPVLLANVCVSFTVWLLTNIFLHINALTMCLKAIAAMVPNTPSCYCMLLM
jgi:hypothetical protein